MFLRANMVTELVYILHDREAFFVFSCEESLARSLSSYDIEADFLYRRAVPGAFLARRAGGKGLLPLGRFCKCPS